MIIIILSPTSFIFEFIKHSGDVCVTLYLKFSGKFIEKHFHNNYFYNFMKMANPNPEILYNKVINVLKV